MTLEEIIIRNFGIYQNPPPIDLRISKKQPIILFGGLNGEGKTTLLDAILLCLYGPLAQTSNRGKKGYHTYLRDCFNKHTTDNEGYIELTFKYQRDGRHDKFCVRRTWTNNSIIQEAISVEVNGQKDHLLQENWLNFIDELIPAKVANLFFFDGEKIEQLADLENAQSLLESALHSLLGLDILNQLNIDLTTLSQRKKVALKSGEKQSEIKIQQQELKTLKEELASTNKLLTAPRTDLIRVKANLEKAADKYKKSGGELYEQRSQLQETKNKIIQERQEAKSDFVEVAATETPLILVQDLLHEVIQQADLETDIQQARAMLSTLSTRDQATLGIVEKIAGKDAKAQVEEQLKADRENYQQTAQQEQYLNLSSDGLKQVHKAAGNLTSTSLQFQKISEKISELNERAEQTDKTIQSIPDTETIKRLRSNVERWEKQEIELTTRIILLEEETHVLSKKIETLQSSIFNNMEKDLNLKFQHEDDQRIIEYSEKAQRTLTELRSQVIKQRVEEIEDLILVSFKQLIRKPRLIGNIKLSTNDYSLTLFDCSSQEISPNRLSAGERQLLAIAILWALAKAAGLQLPVVIDTPLGRLDGTHRNKLLKSYFPRASHQVLILSTDTEIANKYYAELQPFIKRSFQITYNPKNQASQITEGYQFA